MLLLYHNHRAGTAEAGLSLGKAGMNTAEVVHP